MFQSFDSTENLSKDFMDAALKSFAAVSKGSQAIVVEATDYSKRTIERSGAALEQLSAVKSVEKAVELQSDYAKQAYEGFVAQATRMGELYTDMARDAFKPFESAVARAR
jgi:hypothetical protein